MKKILLIDVSHLFFRAFFAIPRGLTNVEGEPVNALFGVSSMILSLLESERPHYIFGAKDEKGKTKRHELIEDYKGQRPEMPSELVAQLPKIFDIFTAFHIPLFSLPGYEGDDILATLSEKYRGHPDFQVEIVSGDHDIFQLVGDNVCIGFPQNGGKAPLSLVCDGIVEKIGVRPEQVPDFKALVGDPSDNFKGVDGIGKKTAAKLLQEFTTLEGIYEHLNDIPGKVQEKLRAGREQAFLLKGIATLHRDLKLPDFNLEAGNVANIAFEGVEQFFRRMQFHSLLNRLPRVVRSIGSATPSEHDALWEEFEKAETKTLTEVQAAAERKQGEQITLF